MLEGLISVLQSSLEVGLIFSLLAIGVVLTYKVLDLADLSVEGTFPLGAFIFAAFTLKGVNPILAMLLSFAGGLAAGFVTYFLYKRLKIAALLAGILTMTMLYSINLRITGKSNVPLFDYENIFSNFSYLPKMLVLIIIVLIVKFLIDYFFKTEQGYLLIVTGDNESLVRSLGKNPDLYIMIGFMLSNGLVSLSGSLMAQHQGFVDSQMGTTMIVTALASIIIGDTFMRNNRRLKLSTRAIIGAIAYRIISGLAIYAGLNPNDLKLITALIVIVFIVYNNIGILGKKKPLIKKE
ncbi:ABC transporter permease [Peptoniphilus catoniae]|uniref:ABC transporter permease n=1 Tax=Peptoniphilus catoniae TaxID=1660341 RepID=UPI0010FF57C8|nr:ABC transporter permease [Peptoniphilus catoniae]